MTVHALLSGTSPRRKGAIGGDKSPRIWHPLVTNQLTLKKRRRKTKAAVGVSKEAAAEAHVDAAEAHVDAAEVHADGAEVHADGAEAPVDGAGVAARVAAAGVGVEDAVSATDVIVVEAERDHVIVIEVGRNDDPPRLIAMNV
jgi:hypothetical protein